MKKLIAISILLSLFGGAQVLAQKNEYTENKKRENQLQHRRQSGKKHENARTRY